MKSRTEALREIATRTFDVCVIGAGATGAGCALDAQLRGLETVLLDAGDFASATSSASTKLAHGGVRYLQEAVTNLDVGQLKVVRQALRERTLMLRNAPHLVHPLEFLVPCFSRFELWYYGLGMKVYDWIAGKAKLTSSRVFSPAQALRRNSSLKTDQLIGAVAYQDAQFDDARYGVTLVKTFANAGGEVANYLRVVGFEKGPDGNLLAAITEDTLSHRQLHVRARVFVNATGPFSDAVRSLANPRALPRLVLSRGVHILLPLDEGIDSALLIPRTEDGRVIFAIPWLGRLLVGTTDQETTLQDELVLSRAEAEYLLRHLNRYSARQRTLGEIVSGFAGIRPLVRPHHAQATKKLIREHEVEVDQNSGLISILGGKWTTYRAMAEDTINAVQSRRGGPSRPSATRQHLLAGAEGYSPDYGIKLAREHPLDDSTARHLAQKFGTDAPAVLDIAKHRPELYAPIIEAALQIQAEVIYCIRQEMAVSIEDVLSRRLGLQQYDWKVAMQAAPIVASHLAGELGWSEMQKDDEIRRYVTKINRFLVAIGAATN
jgi:glycerol-3-phosphate dehydrogenase